MVYTSGKYITAYFPKEVRLTLHILIKAPFMREGNKYPPQTSPLKAALKLAAS